MYHPFQVVKSAYCAVLKSQTELAESCVSFLFCVYTLDVSSCLAKAGVFGCSPGAQRALQGSEGCGRVEIMGDV